MALNYNGSGHNGFLQTLPRLRARPDELEPLTCCLMCVSPLAGTSKGFTVWELLCAVLIGGILLGIGVPSFDNIMLDSERTAAINSFVTAIQLARSEASKRRRPVVLCKTDDGLRCAGKELSFDVGWMVFVNEDDLRPPERSPDEPLLLQHRPSITGPIHANRRLFEFRPFRHRSTNGTVTFCDRRGASAARAVIVSYTGRPRVAARGPRHRPLVCAEAT